MARLKTVYPAHPISGDVEGNLKRVRAIVRNLYFMPGIIPVAPYLMDCTILDDSMPTEREIGMKTLETYFNRGMIDEIWLYGPRISNGMKTEILLAWDYGLSVTPQTKETDLEYDALSGYPDYACHKEVILRRLFRLGPVPYWVLALYIMRTHLHIDTHGVVANMLADSWIKYNNLGMLTLCLRGYREMQILHERFGK